MKQISGSFISDRGGVTSWGKEVINALTLFIELQSFWTVLTYYSPAHGFFHKNKIERKLLMCLSKENNSSSKKRNAILFVIHIFITLYSSYVAFSKTFNFLLSDRMLNVLSTILHMWPSIDMKYVINLVKYLRPVQMCFLWKRIKDLLIDCRFTLFSAHNQVVAVGKKKEVGPIKHWTLHLHKHKKTCSIFSQVCSNVTKALLNNVMIMIISWSYRFN